ncbi:MAG: hypothetical protein AB1489_20745 [Acidobacteriota bacterium]
MTTKESPFCELVRTRRGTEDNRPSLAAPEPVTLAAFYCTLNNGPCRYALRKMDCPVYQDYLSFNQSAESGQPQ